MGCQFVVGPTQTEKQPSTLRLRLTDNLELPINLKYMSVDCGRQPREAQGEHSTKKGPSWNQTSANHCPTSQPSIMNALRYKPQLLRHNLNLAMTQF